MAIRADDRLIEHLRRLVLYGHDSTFSDGDLLVRFVRGRDDVAFAALVRRHGPMVFGVCNRVLRHRQDAEDAFQATFLVLARKAARIAPPEMLGNWLYGVAHKTAIRARTSIGKRNQREQQVPVMPETPILMPERNDDLWRLLDQEVSRLLDKYRAPIVLCDLEGKTRQEAARHLGWPEGSVAGRLARGRAMLAERFAKHDPTLSVGALAAELAQNAASACVPPSLIVDTIKAASLFAVGQTAAAGAISVQVAALAEGTIRIMNVTKWATTTLLIFALAGLGGGLGVGGYQLAQGDSLAPRAKAAVRDDKPAAGEHPQSNISGVAPALHWKHERFKGLGRPFSLVFSPNSKTLVMGCFEGDLVCWDVENRRLLLEWTGHPGPIEALAISPDGNLLASSGDDNEIRVWQLATGARKTSLKGTRSHIDLLSFSPDGKSLTATDATSVILWDVAAEKQRFRLERSLNGSRMPVPSSFTDATSLALVTLNNGKPALKIVDVQTGKLRQNVAIPFAYDGWDESWCTISPLGRWFVQIDRSLRVVDLTAGRGKLYFFGPDPNRNRIGGAYALVVSPDERFAAIALDNHQVVVVELATGLIRGEYSWPGRAYTCFAFSPDCRYLACGAVDRSVLLWDLSGWQFKNARASVALSTADLDRLWDELTTNNGPILQRAIWTFVAGQKKSVTYLKAKLLPVGASREQIANSIRDLGDNNFKARVRAESELEKLHDEAEGQLKKALAEASDLETRRRIEKLVNLIDGPWSRGHIVRSIEVLERCGTPEARQLLELLADNRLSLRRAAAARESLRRWAYATDAVPKQ